MYRPKSNFHVFTKAEIRKIRLNLFRKYKLNVDQQTEVVLGLLQRWKPLTIITKSSILNVATVLDPSLDQNKNKFVKSKWSMHVIFKDSTYLKFIINISKILIKFLDHIYVKMERRIQAIRDRAFWKSN